MIKSTDGKKFSFEDKGLIFARCLPLVVINYTLKSAKDKNPYHIPNFILSNVKKTSGTDHAKVLPGFI